MKKLKYGWHFLIPILLYFPYLYLNGSLIVNLFGCGCPKIDENGNMLANQFNANDFTVLFWSITALTTIVISVLISRKIYDKKKKIVYIIGSVLISVLMSYLCLFATPSWK